jgi:hypothetical protein
MNYKDAYDLQPDPEVPSGAILMVRPNFKVPYYNINSFGEPEDYFTPNFLEHDATFMLLGVKTVSHNWGFSRRSGTYSQRPEYRIITDYLPYVLFNEKVIILASNYWKEHSMIICGP